MNAPFVAKSATLVKSSSAEFWRAHPGRTAILRPARGDDLDPRWWDVQSHDQAEVERRIQAMEAMGFRRWVLFYREGHLGHRDFLAGTAWLFIHIGAGIGDVEGEARPLRHFETRNYVLRGYRHVSAHEFWAGGICERRGVERPTGTSHVPVETFLKLARPLKYEVDLELGWRAHVEQSGAAEYRQSLADIERCARKRAVQRARRLRLATDREWVQTNADALKAGARTAPARLPSCRARLPDAQTLAERLSAQLSEVF